MVYLENNFYKAISISKVGISLDYLLQFFKKEYFKKLTRFLEYLRDKGYPFFALSITSFLSEPIISLRSSLYFMLGYIYPFRFHGLNPKNLTKTEASQRAILLLHGNYHNQSAFLFFAKSLKKKGLGPIYTVNLPSGVLGEKDHEIVEKKLLEIERQYARYQKKPTIDLVGHSRGAEMAFSLRKKRGANAKGIQTKRFTFGKVIRLGLSTSPFLRKSLSDEELKTIYEIDAEFDTICKIEEKSSQRPENKSRSFCGHLGLLYDKPTIEKVVNWLKGKENANCRKN